MLEPRRYENGDTSGNVIATALYAEEAWCGSAFAGSSTASMHGQTISITAQIQCVQNDITRLGKLAKIHASPECLGSRLVCVGDRCFFFFLGSQPQSPLALDIIGPRCKLF